ncbi:hypothetical protein AH2_00076 [Burkholderia phage vB_BceS_AH2]|uniref:Uncharacterized protein n=1 Tax=Burkholderia phage vB_BceS_AH2 TaxID=1133022 RepID=I6NST2_9CAUD|nr:hypothetical protein B613_gp76 [Burkholderia phage vB_BceS_AH2]AEY69586.1 hypothetical protein AH2_00076 [Burkholderia phage vB_BceS_AH2]
MSIEKLLGDLIDAVNANTEALKAGGGAASSGKNADDGGSASTGRGRGRGASSNKNADDGDSGGKKYTADDVKAAAVKVKEKLGTKEAKKLISDHGADELAKLEPKVFAAFIADCEKALKADEDGGGNGDDEL